MADLPAVGLISCGNMGMGLADALVASGAGRLVAVADVDEAKAKAAGEKLSAAVYRSHTDLLGHAGLDAVLIAAPPFLHASLALDAIAAGKHVFVEKPFALSLEDCDRVIGAAREAGRRLMVGQVLRYYPTWRYLRERVAAGEIGRPLGIRVTRIGGGWGTWDVTWRRERAKSGGMILEIHAHEIDFLNCLGGPVERVYGAMGTFGETGCDYPNLAFLSLHFQSGALGLLHASQTSAIGDLSGVIEGDEGAFQYHDGFSRNAEILLRRRSGETLTVRVGDLKYEAPVQAEMREFATAIVEGRETAIPGEEGRRVIAVALAAYRSMETGRAEPVG
jgi:UDP-N-acetylglucosamine 3-dehydrogenase